MSTFMLVLYLHFRNDGYYFLYKFMYFIIYFWLRWVFIAVHRLSPVVASRGYPSLRCTGFSLRWLLLLRNTGSRHAGFSSCGLRALERRLSSCSTRAYLLCGVWDLPGPGLKPVSPASAGGFLTTVTPEKPMMVNFKCHLDRATDCSDIWLNIILFL